MKSLLITLAFLLFSAHVWAQASLPKAANVTVGKSSILACYHNIEFVLDNEHGKIHVCGLDAQNRPVTHSIDALIRMRDDFSWKAEAAHGLTIVVNATSGATILTYNDQVMVWEKPGSL